MCLMSKKIIINHLLKNSSPFSQYLIGFPISWHFKGEKNGIFKVSDSGCFFIDQGAFISQKKINKLKKIKKALLKLICGYCVSHGLPSRWRKTRQEVNPYCGLFFPFNQKTKKQLEACSLNYLAKMPTKSNSLHKCIGTAQ